MKNIFKNYGEWILGLAGLVLFASIIWVFSWGILLISGSMSQAFGSLGRGQNAAATFRVDQAKELDFKGLKN